MAKSFRLIDLPRARYLLSYNEDTGIFVWRVDRGKMLAGMVAGIVKPSGYVYIGIDYTERAAHRLAWAFATGEQPDASVQIDHINGIKQDNRIANLRLANYSENGVNQRGRKNNTSGYKGVSWSRAHNIWQVSIEYKGVRKTLGYSHDIEEASRMYESAAKELHGTFYRPRSSTPTPC